ncbi:tetratricopeptide repeat protein [Bradyrhizobium sp. Arg62]|uniref:tetratricopeptide repeat protein n=1 Tax=Bradyrhizobium brasilense TaxID=1419277 RepID=UPI001E423649|nr:tetratricopeptide repeat protein [Bradyrhizobium brasilense]MCC8943855.1 tetratricopeptide repeat protein [Bradyrhizobium brasilense]
MVLEPALDRWRLQASLIFGWRRATTGRDKARGRPHNRSSGGEAIAYARNAIELDPNTAAGCRLLACALAFAGDPAEAIAAAEQALRASPRDPMQWVTFGSIANAHFAKGRYQLAFEFADRAARLAPDWAGSYLTLASSAAHLGLIEEARAAIARALELGPRHRLTAMQNRPLFGKPEVVARYLDGLRRSGLPE